MNSSDAGALITAVVYLAIPVVLIVVGFVVGKTRELLHLWSLRKRERANAHILLTNLRKVPPATLHPMGELVCGQAVIATDYFKSFTASLRKFIGGDVRSFERLMERARREAIIRMIDDARALGADAVVNVRLETSNIVSSGGFQNFASAAEVLAYGTAVKLKGV
jgi:uncharacterized protein YbjQ (UPF0145 family)